MLSIFSCCGDNMLKYMYSNLNVPSNVVVFLLLKHSVWKEIELYFTSSGYTHTHIHTVTYIW